MLVGIIVEFKNFNKNHGNDTYQYGKHYLNL